MIAHHDRTDRAKPWKKEATKKSRLYVSMAGFPEMTDAAYIRKMRDAIYAANLNGAACSFSRKAGCGCGCSPGFVSKGGLGKTTYVSAYNVEINRSAITPVFPVSVFR